jgi:F420-0:gamma-glutamyl ligase-like protein
MNPRKVFLYGELQCSIPFTEVDWRSTNTMLKTVKGLVRKTWLSGINTNTVGGLYEFDSLENARAFAEGIYAEAAQKRGASLTVKLFDGDVVEEASRNINSPHYS